LTELVDTLRYSEVLSDRFVRVVVIAAPPKDHFSLAAAALKKARHVLFKRP
jgi:predicted dehydrogenase